MPGQRPDSDVEDPVFLSPEESFQEEAKAEEKDPRAQAVQ